MIIILYPALYRSGKTENRTPDLLLRKPTIGIGENQQYK